MYARVPCSSVALPGGTLIDVRWLCTNTGYDVHRDDRPRLVGKEFRRWVHESLYAATPPLEAMRTTLSHAATHEKSDGGTGGGRRRMRHIMVNDVKRS